VQFAQGYYVAEPRSIDSLGAQPEAVLSGIAVA